MTLRRLRLTDTDLPLHGTEGTRSIEHAAATLLPPHALMARAGLAAARLAVAVAPDARRIRVHAGPGNNGGDGAEAAHWLQRWGRQVDLVRVAWRETLPADAAWALQRAVEAGVVLRDPGNLGAHDGARDATGADPAIDLHIDALLGVGATRPLQGELAAACAGLHSVAARVLALDLPTGLSADTGAADAAAVSAAWTLSLLTLKPGLFTAQGRDLAGEVWWDDLDTSDTDTGIAPLAWLPAAPRLLPFVRPHASHKGRFGDVQVLGGDTGMAGALRLAGQAALAAGAGRVHATALGGATEPALDAALMTRSPADALAPGRLASCTVLAGCGGGTAIEPLLGQVLQHAPRVVLDADALNALARSPALQAALAHRRGTGRPVVITPHPLEAARLLDTDVATVQADRLRAAQALATGLGAVVVLKGSGTVVASAGRAPWIVPLGNAALATAGTGDVLAGWLAGTWAAGSGSAGAESGVESGGASGDTAAAAAAALISVARHAQAADRFAAAGRSVPLTATELIRWMSAARAA